MRRRYKTLAISTGYWKPGENYLMQIADSIKNRVDDGDFLTISEKAVSTAMGNIVDESVVQPGLAARFIANVWMRIVWGHILGLVCHLRRETVQQIRAYPLRNGSMHKQVALQYSGLLQALMHGSEGGIDGSNLPYSYVCLPLPNPQKTAYEICEQVKRMLSKTVTVILVDTDKTYSFRNFHFTPRPKPISGIHSFGGFIAYVAGRFLRLRKRSTPIAIAGSRLRVEEALEVAEIANRARGFGAGRTVWDMAKTFKVDLTGVTWAMLDKVEHKPIVIVKAM